MKWNPGYISDTKENENKEAQLAVPGASNMNKGDHPVNQELRVHPSSPSSVPLEANLIPSHTGNTNADSNIEPHSTPPQFSPSTVLIHNDQASLKPTIEIPK